MKKITALLILLTLSEVALATTIVCLREKGGYQPPHYLQIDAENKKIEKLLILADKDKGIYFEEVDIDEYKRIYFHEVDIDEHEFSEEYIKYGDYRINRYSLDWQRLWDDPNSTVDKIGKCQISDIKIDILKKELDEIKNRKRKI